MEELFLSCNVHDVNDVRQTYAVKLKLFIINFQKKCTLNKDETEELDK